jgi:catechol 2,3-dioxygenase-like lactoylglutathione lyase family enzyme
MSMLGYDAEPWSGGMNYVCGDSETYFCLLPASAEHLAAGYHRKRIGLNHLAFRGKCRAQVDQIAKWVKDSGYTLLYDDRHPFAGGPNYYAVFVEDPDRFKLEVVAPSDA